MSDSESDDPYGPPLPPGFNKPSKKDSSSEEDSYGPLLPPTKDDNRRPYNKEKQEHFGPSLPPAARNNSNMIGPALPPQLVNPNSSDSGSDSDHSDTNNKRTIGPAMPPGMERSETSHSSHSKHRNSSIMLGPQLPVQHSDSGEYSDSDECCMIGPSVNMKSAEGDTRAVVEFEERARKMRERLTGKTDESEKTQARESWMTELPELAGADLGLTNRQFRKKAAPTQDTSWTDTPEEKERKKDSKKRKKDEDVYFPSEKELQTAKEIEAHNKSKRPESLMDMHEKKRKKEMKKPKDEPMERRAFDRDLDLQVNRLDNAQRKAIIKRSQDLGSKFKSGGTGTSFL